MVVVAVVVLIRLVRAIDGGGALALPGLLLMRREVSLRWNRRAIGL